MRVGFLDRFLDVDINGCDRCDDDGTKNEYFHRYLLQLLNTHSM